MKEGRKPEYPQKPPRDELQKMLHTTGRSVKPQARLKPAQQHWWQARRADVLTVTPRAGPQGRIHLDNYTCCCTEIDVTDKTFYLIQSQVY